MLQLCLLALLCLCAFVLLPVGVFDCVVGFRLLRLMIPFMVGGLMVILFERLGLVLCVWVMICLGGFGFLLDLLLRLVVSVFGCVVSLFWVCCLVMVAIAC